MPAPDTNQTSPAEDLALIAQIAEEAGQIAHGYFRRDPEVWWKEGTSPVSEADYAVDRFLHEHLRAARPSYGWLSEETDATLQSLSEQRLFIVDPIDGTRAFIGGKTTWCVSVAVVEAGRSIAGALICPALGETYLAHSHGEPLLNGAPISVRASGERLQLAGPKPMLSLLPEELAVRTEPHGYIPSLAYRIAMVASGVLDGTFIKANAHDWDIAAADLILERAGGALLDGAGHAPVFGGKTARHGALVAGRAQLAREMAGLLP